MDINEVFDDITLSENKFTEAGFSEGLKAGQSNSHLEGEKLGSERGTQIGSEIGFYSGFVAEYKLHYLEPKDKKSEKIISVLRKIETLVTEFPAYNSKEGFEEKLEDIRAKFKLLCSLLKISSEFSTSRSSW